MMEGAGRQSAQGSVSALEKREGGGLKARGAGGKAKRPLNVTLTTGSIDPEHPFARDSKGRSLAARCVFV